MVIVLYMKVMDVKARLQDLWNLCILTIAGLKQYCGGCIELDVARCSSMQLDVALVASLFLFVEAAAAALGEAGKRLARTQSEVRMQQ